MILIDKIKVALGPRGTDHKIVTIPVELLIAADMGPSRLVQRVVRVEIRGYKEDGGAIRAWVEVVKQEPEDD